jgi:hypothetical protein
MPDERGLVSTDEAILDSIGESDEQTSDESSEEQTSGTETETETETSTASSEQSTTGSNDQEQQGQARGPQDLVDKDGNVIATGGKERRFYETAQREKQRADNTQRELETLKAQMQAVNDAGNLGTQYSLTPEELTTGAQIISAYKENPVETLQYMLTQAQSAGHNIDALLAGGGGMDTQAIKQMIDNAVKPLVSEQQGKLETEAANQAALEQYNAFNAKHPDAAIHENSIARLLQDDPTLSPEAAYLKLQNFYLQKGLDWNKSLGTLQQEHDANKGPVENTQQQLPNGNVNANNVTDTARVADVNTSTGDIVKDAMREAGMEI